MSDEADVLAANAAYYRAFERADYKGMESVWAVDGVSCIHPGWAMILGREEVLRSYRMILDNPAQDPVTAAGEIVFLMGAHARVLCVEMVAGGALAATNLFTRGDDGWRLVHHHASPMVTRMPRAQPTRQLN